MTEVKKSNCAISGQTSNSPIIKQKQGKMYLISPRNKANFRKWPKQKEDRIDGCRSNGKSHRRSSEQMKFKDGGTKHDPLNLLGLSEKVDGQDSPEWASKCDFEPTLFRPVDESDPLGLNSLGEHVVLQVPKKNKKRRRRNTYHGEDENKEKTKGSKSESELEIDKHHQKAKKRSSLPVSANNKVSILPPIDVGDSVSEESKPVSQQDMPKLPTAESILTQDNSSSSRVSQNNTRHRWKGNRKKQRDRQSRGRGNFKELKEKSFRMKDLRFRYGNYNRYYGYRNANAQDDIRLEVLSKDWFEQKDVLDIGCNVGHLTLWVAKHCKPTHIKGVDIDVDLIKAAKANIRHYVSEEEEKMFPQSLPILYGPLAPPVSQVTDNTKKRGFPFNVSFVSENFVPSSDQVLSYVKEGLYDTITCFSVTKWIQLNWGDAGLKRTFQKIYKQLKPGGIFVMEPQPFSSYTKKKNLTPDIRANYDAMQFLPDHFITYLLSDEVGFCQSELVNVPFAIDKPKGFHRSIYLLTKGRSPSPPLQEEAKDT